MGMRAGLAWTEIPDDSVKELPSAGPPYLPVDSVQPNKAESSPAGAGTPHATAIRDRESLDLVVCKRCDRTILRASFDDHALVCSSLPTVDEELAAATALAAAGAKRKSPPSGGGGPARAKGGGGTKAACHGPGSSTLAAGASSPAARSGAGTDAQAVAGTGGGGGPGNKPPSKKKRAGSHQHHKGGGAVGAEKGSKAARARIGPSAVDLVAQNAEELRAREGESLTAQWRVTLALLRAPPRRAPTPLVDRDALYRQLRPRARVVPLPADAPTTMAAGRPPSSSAAVASRAQSSAAPQVTGAPVRLPAPPSALPSRPSTGMASTAAAQRA